MGIEKKNNAVVFGLTADHVFAVACVMMDLKRFSPSMVDEVVVIHDGIRKKDREVLGSILPTRFILYSFPLKSARILNARAVRYFTKMVFTKFECLRLLDDYKNVMWMDYDMVVQNDIQELFSSEGAGIKLMPSGAPVSDQLLSQTMDYDMQAEGISACIFVLQDNLKHYQKMYRFCYESLEKYAEILYLPEQAIFDFMVQQFNLKPVPIDRLVYSAHPTEDFSPNAKILHAFGPLKFWNGLENEQWRKNYQSWIDMGGSKYKDKSTLDRILMKYKSVVLRFRYRIEKMFWEKVQ